MRLADRLGWGTTAGVVLLVAAALAVVVGAGGWLASQERELAAQQAFAHGVVDRVLSVAAALEAGRPDARQAVLRRFHAPRFRLWLAERPPEPRRRWHDADLVEEAARSALSGDHHSADHHSEIHIHASSGQPPPWRSGNRAVPPESWRPGYYTLTVAIPLDAGGWVVAAAPSAPLARRPASATLVSLGLAVFFTVAVAMAVAHRMTRPLRALAGAAERLSTDLDAPPLPQKGAREMRRAAAAFNEMQERLRRMVDDRNLMLAALSHDLRTIITRLRLRAEDIAEEERRTKALRDLADMEVMLREALDVAQGAASREGRRAVDLAALLRSLIDDLADAGREAAFEGPERLVVSCRPVALRRALANLIDNALRYGGGAEVSLSQRPGGVLVEVSDRGPGIPETSREEMFRPFMRGEPSRNRSTGGTGLGLAVARSIFRAHGGEVTLGDRPGGGLVATAMLPLVPVPGAEPAAG